MFLPCNSANRFRYAASWLKESMIWEIGIAIHVKAEAQKFPRAR